jgi:hypothetical protein
MFSPMRLLAFLATVTGVLAVATLPQQSSFLELVISLATSWTLATIGEEIVWSAVVLVMSEGSLELLLHRATKTGVTERERVFGRDSDLLVFGSEHVHVLRFDGISNAHGKSGWIHKLRPDHTQSKALLTSEHKAKLLAKEEFLVFLSEVLLKETAQDTTVEISTSDFKTLATDGFLRIILIRLIVVEFDTGIL